MNWSRCYDGGKVISSQFVPVIEGLLSDDFYFGGICKKQLFIIYLKIYSFLYLHLRMPGIMVVYQRYTQ